MYKYYVALDGHEEDLIVRRVKIVKDKRNNDHTVRVEIGPSLTFVDRDSLCDVDDIPKLIKELLGE